MNGITTDVDISAKVAFLSRPSSYADNTDSVEAVETHVSWVFLTDHFVYKMKKPVLLDILDLRTLGQRQRNCQEELRLNRRLARDVYLDVLTLTQNDVGQLELAGEGGVVEWLVKMRRLPRDCMLDYAIARGEVTESQVRRITQVLADFYQKAEPESLTTDAYIQQFKKRVQANEAGLLETTYSLPRRQIGRISQYLLRYLSEAGSIFDARIKAQRIVEAHGDLRPEHVCLTDPPVFIDCLEFSRSLRIMDTADELGFLSMECDIAGAAFIGPLLFKSYRQYSGDNPPRSLVCFYKAYRAQLWAKLALWHIKGHDADETAHWTRRARAYLRLAVSFLEELKRCSVPH